MSETEQNARVDRFLADPLRGAAAPWPVGEDPWFSERVLARSALHGVRPLLVEAPGTAQLLRWGWPEAVVAAFREAAIASAVWELGHRKAIGDALGALHSAGVRPVLFKGTALAYSLYHNPATRSRGDTDLIVAPHERDIAIDVLRKLGFERGGGIFGDFVTSEVSLVRVDPFSGSHCVDLHWRLSNSPLLARIFSVEELRAENVAVPALGTHAREVTRPHALAIACVHRLVHSVSPYYVDGDAHCNADRLIWLYDIKLLLEQMTPGELAHFAALAKAREIIEVCRDGIDSAVDWLGVRVPDELVLGEPSPAARPEHVAGYLHAGPVRRTAMNVAAVAGWGNRWRYLFELFIPAPEYMRRKYSGARFRWLPWLYLRRAFSGVSRRLRGIGRRRAQ